MIEVLKQALEALESYYGYMEPLTTVFGGPRVPAEQSTTGKVERAITSLHQAIAEAEKQERNFCSRCGKRLGKNEWDIHTCTPPEAAVAEQHKKQSAERVEPVAWLHWLHGPVRLFLNKDEAMMELNRLNREYPVDNDARKMRPLVFGDTSPPQRQPLTDEQIAVACGWMPERGCKPLPDELRIARAIEAAHGIKE